MRACILIAALLFSGCSHTHTITAAEPEPLTNPLPGNTYRALPAIRVMQWAFTDSAYTIVTTVDNKVVGTSHGHYQLWISTLQIPPVWSGIRGWFERGSYLRDGTWFDTDIRLNFSVPFRWSPGVATIDGVTYYKVAL